MGFLFLRLDIINNAMIHVCPNCGYSLECQLSDGLTHCGHCKQVFDSSDYNKLLSAAWQVRRENICIERMKWQTKLDDDLCLFVYLFVHDYEYTHEDFAKLLKKLGVAHKSYIDYST